MKNILKISSAFIGVLVGAGFASGQELLQYFTSYGHLGTIGAFVTIAIFGYIGLLLLRLGSRTKAESHQDVIHRISGKFLGTIIDYILIAILVGIGTVMIAGSGAIFQQQFGLPEIVGTLLMTVLVIITVLSNVDRVVKVIAAITPLLIVFVLFLFVYSLSTMDTSYTALEPLAKEQPSATGNWLVSAINYVSLGIAMAAPMAIVMGGDESSSKEASLGGLVGGLAVGLLVVICHFTLFSRMDVVAGLDMPFLGLANDASIYIGLLYSVIIFLMIYNSAISLFFSFGTRFFAPKTKKFNILVITFILGGFATSFVGFTELVSLFYPIFGYLGMLLIVILLIAPFRLKIAKS
ncbi:putative membrane protein YkvI [Alkalihalobacillus xiaoxiensis]|uniref:Membrane protein YkvI n=1 Tax=Shouchella xiaoxiensis TaxID=766895 RepID=A0ABS2STX5_9BACI|nr:hypothetical protein [Shouchella xiaoxiensis]MBM7838967.1 putative membrane protein YkvI [Shouchella xiaoxiensis]